MVASSNRPEAIYFSNDDLAAGGIMHCLSENGAMMHLARKQGMLIVTEKGESDARLELPPADASSYVYALLAERLTCVIHNIQQCLDQ